jgi:hypothetical protein
LKDAGVGTEDMRYLGGIYFRRWKDDEDSRGRRHLRRWGRFEEAGHQICAGGEGFIKVQM